MKKTIVELFRGRLLAIPELPLIRLERTVHLSPTVQGQVYALESVASRDIDVIVTDDFESPRDPRDTQIVCVSRKTGKYDGAERDRILLRRQPGYQVQDLPEVELVVQDFDGTVDLVVYGWRDGVETEMIRRSYWAWTDAIRDATHAEDIVRWHWRRYYAHLGESDMESVASGFGEACVGLTLAQANRLASRELYQLSRVAGWRKLTLREQAHLGLEGQWHRDAVVAERRALRAGGSPTGCGERTVLASSMAAQIDDWMDRHNAHRAPGSPGTLSRIGGSK